MSRTLHLSLSHYISIEKRDAAFTTSRERSRCIICYISREKQMQRSLHLESDVALAASQHRCSKRCISTISRTTQLLLHLKKGRVERDVALVTSWYRCSTRKRDAEAVFATSRKRCSPHCILTVSISIVSSCERCSVRYISRKMQMLSKEM